MYLFYWQSKCRAITLLSVSFQYQHCNTCGEIFKGENCTEKGFSLVYKEMETAEKFNSLPQSSFESSCPDSAATCPFSLLDYFPVAALQSSYRKQGDFDSNKVPKACS